MSENSQIDMDLGACPPYFESLGVPPQILGDESNFPNQPKQSWQPKSETFKDLFQKSLDHHPACGCGLCCAVSSWDENDDKDALLKESNSATPSRADDGVVYGYDGTTLDFLASADIEAYTPITIPTPATAYSEDGTPLASFPPKEKPVAKFKSNFPYSVDTITKLLKFNEEIISRQPKPLGTMYYVPIQNQFYPVEHCAAHYDVRGSYLTINDPVRYAPIRYRLEIIPLSEEKWMEYPLQEKLKLTELIKIVPDNILCCPCPGCQRISYSAYYRIIVNCYSGSFK